MELSKYISRCRNPRVVVNKRGDSVCTSCGHCPDCQARKMAKLTSLAINESKCCQKTFFIGLSYDDENIPTMLLKQVKADNGYKFIQCIDMTNRFVNPVKARNYYQTKQDYYEKYGDNPLTIPFPKRNFAKRKTKTYGEEIHRINALFKDDLFKQFYDKAHDYTSKLFQPKKYRWLPYLCKEDLQKFLKRLRFRISSEYNTEIRFFAVGEYSPEHFRPHFHVNLYVNEPRLYSDLERIVRETWQYGISFCEPALTNEGCASYCSSYTNSFTALPSFLNGTKIAPFSLHSQNFGTLYNAEIRDFIYTFNEYPFESFDVSVDDNIFRVSLSDVIAHNFFPRCYNYECQDASSRYQLYTCYTELSKKYNFTRCSALARCVIIDSQDFYNRTLLTAIDIIPSPIDSNVKSFYSGRKRSFYDFSLISDKIQSGQSLDDEEMSVYNRIYSVINMSKLFCFNAKSPSLGNCNPFKALISKIDDFWHQRAQYNLSTQYLMQQEYYERFLSDDFDIFYPIGCKGDYKMDVYDKNEYIKQFNFYKDIMYRDKIKHKAQNDKNNIFV